MTSHYLKRRKKNKKSIEEKKPGLQSKIKEE